MRVRLPKSSWTRLLLLLIFAAAALFLNFVVHHARKASVSRAAAAAQAKESEFALPPPITPKEGELTAQEILAKMAETYAACSSYEDHGSVISEFQSDHPFTARLVFKTAFIRPDHFRFEHRSQSISMPLEWKRNVVLKNGAETNVIWSFKPGPEKSESLAMAIAGATGISSGAAHTIPRMLLPEDVTGWVLTNLEDATLYPSGSVAGRLCYRVAGRSGKSGTESLWIDQQSFLLLKTVQKTRRPRVIQTTTYHPTINTSIPAEIFQFRPPSVLNEDHFQKLQGEAAPVCRQN